MVGLADICIVKTRLKSRFVNVIHHGITAVTNCGWRLVNVGKATDWAITEQVREKTRITNGAQRCCYFYFAF